MCPILSLFYSHDARCGNAVPDAYIPVSSGRRADRNNVRNGQFCLRVTDSLVRNLPPFGISVGHIFGVRSKEKMVGVHARGRVTPMTNAHARWYGSIHGLPCKAMDGLRIPFHRQLPIAISIAATSPQYTASRAYLGVMRHALFARPVRGALKSFRFDGSHSIALLRRSMVRAAIASEARLRPVISTKKRALKTASTSIGVA